jgi:hypothetical protein
MASDVSPNCERSEPPCTICVAAENFDQSEAMACLQNKKTGMRRRKTG